MLYNNSSKKRPKKNLKGGFGNYCCVPLCKSAFYNSERQPTAISLFQVPAKKTVRDQWLKILNKYRRKGGVDKFDVRKKLYICEFHFNANEISISLGIGRKTLKKDVLPTKFDLLKKDTSKRLAPRKPPKERLPPFIETDEISTTEDESFSESESEEIIMSDDYDGFDQQAEEVDTGTLLKLEIEQLKEKVLVLEKENNELKSRSYCYENVKASKTDFKSETGFDNETFLKLLEFLEPGEDCCNLKMYDTSQRLSEETFTFVFKVQVKIYQSQGENQNYLPQNSYFCI